MTGYRYATASALALVVVSSGVYGVGTPHSTDIEVVVVFEPSLLGGRDEGLGDGIERVPPCD